MIWGPTGLPIDGALLREGSQVLLISISLPPSLAHLRISLGPVAYPALLSELPNQGGSHSAHVEGQEEIALGPDLCPTPWVMPRLQRWEAPGPKGLCVY